MYGEQMMCSSTLAKVTNRDSVSLHFRSISFHIEKRRTIPLWLCAGWWEQVDGHTGDFSCFKKCLHPFCQACGRWVAKEPGIPLWGAKHQSVEPTPVRKQARFSGTSRVRPTYFSWVSRIDKTLWALYCGYLMWNLCCALPLVPVVIHQPVKIFCSSEVLEGF